MMPVLCMAQNDRAYIRNGNKLFYSKNYSSAEVQYRKALSVNPENPQALYNLGCALMMQNKSSEAVKFYEKASSLEKSKLRKSKIYHNIGIVCQSGKMYDEAIKAYSESLRNNPHDDETRYNLALCKKLRKNSKDKNKQNQKQNNKDKNNKGKDNKKQKSDKPDQNKDNKNQNNAQQPQMSKDNAEQLLNAAMQQEQETQQKLSKNRQQQQAKHLDKNW